MKSRGDLSFPRSCPCCRRRRSAAAAAATASPWRPWSSQCAGEALAISPLLAAALNHPPLTPLPPAATACRCPLASWAARAARPRPSDWAACPSCREVRLQRYCFFDEHGLLQSSSSAQHDKAAGSAAVDGWPARPHRSLLPPASPTRKETVCLPSSLPPTMHAASTTPRG